MTRKKKRKLQLFPLCVPKLETLPFYYLDFQAQNLSNTILTFQVWVYKVEKVVQKNLFSGTFNLWTTMGFGFHHQLNKNKKATCLCSYVGPKCNFSLILIYLDFLEHPSEMSDLFQSGNLEIIYRQLWKVKQSCLAYLPRPYYVSNVRTVVDRPPENLKLAGN